MTTRAGRYEVESELGRGTMGVVYLAFDRRVRRRVALKALDPPQGLSADQQREYRERFAREAHAAGAVSHPGIVTIFDVDEDPDGGALLIAMEHVAGRDLRQLLEISGRLAPEQAFHIAEAIADALDAAHRSDVVHRDVKPANVMVRESDGAVKIADFGVARLSTSELTRTGTTIGSPAYMSPEQIRGQEIDGRSDLFSLAVILYEMLCGERPFQGDDVAALTYAIAHGTPEPITRRVPGLPAALDAFFARALAKDPADRYPDGGAFRTALRQAGSAACAVDAEAGGEASAVRTPAEQVVAGLDDDDSSGAFGHVPAARARWLGRPSLFAGVFLAVVLAAWMFLGGGGAEAYIRLDARSSVEAGAFSLLVDGREVYARRLAAEVGGKRGKRLLRRVLGKGQESFEAWIEVPAGKHEVVARVTPDGGEPFSDTIVVDLEPGGSQRLRMVAGRSFGTPLSLQLE